MTAPAIPLDEFDQEMATTRRLLERVPDDKGPWKPHEKSFPLGHLAQLVAWMPGWITRTLREPHIDLATGEGYSFQPTAKLLSDFDKNVAAAREITRPSGSSGCPSCSFPAAASVSHQAFQSASARRRSSRVIAS